VSGLGRDLLGAITSGLGGRILRALAAHGVLGEPRVIRDRTGVSPYLSRYYLRGRPYMMDGSSPYNDSGNPKVDAIFPQGIGVYIHRFHQSDGDSALHNHPWRWAISLILAGGYREERRTSTSEKTGDRWWEKHSVEVFEYRPGDINVLTSETFHRVDLFEDEAWSLFVVGPKFSHWGFWNRASQEMTPWRTFLAAIRNTSEDLS
jgi:hypothetical protein